MAARVYQASFAGPGDREERGRERRAGPVEGQVAGGTETGSWGMNCLADCAPLWGRKRSDLLEIMIFACFFLFNYRNQGERIKQKPKEILQADNNFSYRFIS